MGRRSINTTKSGKFMNPTDQFRKEARKRELKKNKKQRTMVRTAVLKGKDPMKLLEEMEIIDRMEYNPMQPPSLNEKVLREKRKKLKETYDRVFKLYEKERPDFAVELRKANSEYEKRRNQMQLLFDQVRNAERVQLDQIPLPEPPVEMGIPGAIPLPADMPLYMAGMMPLGQYPMFQPHSILKKTSAYGTPMMTGPQIPAHLMKPKKKKPPGPPPGPPPALSDSEDEEDMGDVDYRVNRDGNQKPVDDDAADRYEDRSRHREDNYGRSRRIRFADDEDEDNRSRDSEEEERSERRRERRERKKKRREERSEREKKRPSSQGSTKVSALQAMMLKMAGQEVPDDEEEAKEEVPQRSASSSSSSSSSEEDDYRRRRRERSDEDRRIHTKEREIERRRREISQLDDRPPGVDDPADRLTEEEAKALAAARLIEEAEAEAETLHDDTPRLNPPGPPPGLPPNVAGMVPGLPPGPPPGAPPMFMRPPPMRGALPRLMPPGPPPGRPQGMPPGPPPGLPSNLRPPPGMRVPMPVGMPPVRMIRLPGGPPGMMPPGIPPPHLPPMSAPGGSSSILTAPPSIMKPREGEVVSGGSAGQSRVTIQAKPQIKSKMGDVTRFMPTALKVKRESRDQKGRLRTGKEEEPKMIGAQAMPQPQPAAQTGTKDDAYDQFMKEMQGLI